MEKVVVRGVALDKNQARVIISNLADKPGSAARVFQSLADAAVNVDMIVQNVGHNGVANLTFTVSRDEAQKAEKALLATLDELGGGHVAVVENIAKLSVVGVGMKTHAGVAATLFRSLAAQQINIDLISTSEIKISVVISLDRAEDAVRAAHTAFGLEQLG
jgi:aspartate kinase